MSNQSLTHRSQQEGKVRQREDGVRTAHHGQSRGGYQQSVRPAHMDHADGTDKYLCHQKFTLFARH